MKMNTAKLTSIVIPLIFFVLLVLSLAFYIQRLSSGKIRISGQKENISTRPYSKPTLKPLPTLKNEKKQGEFISEARKDLSKKINVQQEEITTKSVESVVWNDASLGCPEKGKLYPQVLTPGYRIILQAGEKTYNYHTSKTSIKLCRSKL